MPRTHSIMLAAKSSAIRRYSRTQEQAASIDTRRVVSTCERLAPTLACSKEMPPNHDGTTTSRRSVHSVHNLVGGERATRPPSHSTVHIVRAAHTQVEVAGAPLMLSSRDILGSFVPATQLHSAPLTIRAHTTACTQPTAAGNYDRVLLHHTSVLQPG